MANNETTTLPAHLTLTENGYHEPLPYWKNPEVDDEEWISYGWKAITYEGHLHYSHKEKANVQQWLAEHGYQDTGDGIHFQRQMCDRCHKAVNALYDVTPAAISDTTTIHVCQDCYDYEVHELEQDGYDLDLG